MGQKRKKGEEQKTKKSKVVHDPNKNHQASLPDGWKILPNIVRSSGLFEAFVVAKQLDLRGRQGTVALRRMMESHLVTVPGGREEWEEGPASWMARAMEAAKKKDPALVLKNIVDTLPLADQPYEVAMDAAKLMDKIGLPGETALYALEQLDEPRMKEAKASYQQHKEDLQKKLEEEKKAKAAAAAAAEKAAAAKQGR